VPSHISYSSWTYFSDLCTTHYIEI